MKESNIVYQRGQWWIANADKRYTVYKDGVTVARADSSYPHTEDGLSIAKARVDYLYSRNHNGGVK